MTVTLSSSLTLPCGATLSNRIVKAAMSEGMADVHGHATPRLEALYRRWGKSGAGLLLSGNIQVDRDHLERPLNIVLDGTEGLPALRRMVEAGRADGAHFWAQISHTGRQVSSHINSAPLSCSDVEIDVIRDAGFSFAAPRAMSEAEIADAVGRFAHTARLAQQAGFTGVEVHGAHGYLISQFLSPLSNTRTDHWGGSLANRARFLLVVIAAIRAAVGPKFPIGLKLNASDFQKGAFTAAECREVVGWLNNTSLDLLELSGGSLEQPKVVGVALKDEGEDGRRTSTIQREAYFIEFAAGITAVAKMPVMVTGGFRTLSGMTGALADAELDLVGIGRPMIADPGIPTKLLAGAIERTPTPEANIGLLQILPWFNMQLEAIAAGKEPDPALDGDAATAAFIEIEGSNMARLLQQRASEAA